MASTNNCLAQTNKSRTEGNATKTRKYTHRQADTPAVNREAKEGLEMNKRVTRMLTLLFPVLVVAALYVVGRLGFPDLWSRF